MSSDTDAMPEKEARLSWSEIKEHTEEWVAHWPFQYAFSRGASDGAQLRVGRHAWDERGEPLEELGKSLTYDWLVVQNGARTKRGNEPTREGAMRAAEAAVERR